MIDARKHFFVFLSLSFLLLGCTEPGQIRLAQIIEQNAAAMGGSATIESVWSIKIEVVIVEDKQKLTANYSATRDGLMRIDVFDGADRVFTEAFDGKHGWQAFNDLQEVADMSRDGEAAVRRGIQNNLYGLHELPGLGFRLEFAGEEEIDEIRYWKVDAIAPDGFLRRLYINGDTWLVERVRERSALHPDLDAEKRRFETRVSDYRETTGRLFSREAATIDLDSGEVVQETRVQQIAVNVPMAPGFFARPETPE